MQVHLITLGVDNIARARAFYEKLLKQTPSSASNDHIAFFDLHGTKLGLFHWKALAQDAQVNAKGSGFRRVTLAHNVKSKRAVNKHLERAVACGARLVKPAQDVFWGGYSGYFADLDDHLWEIAWNPFFAINNDGSISLP